MSHVFFILICFIWGTSFLLMKTALPAFGFADVSMLRASTGAGVLLLLALYTRPRWSLRRADIVPMMLLAIIGYAVPYSLQPFVIDRVEAQVGHGSAFGGLIIALVPLFTIAAQAVLLDTLPTPRQWVGVIGGLALMVLLGWDEVRRGVPVGVFMLAAITPLCYATANTYVKRRFEHVSPLVISATAMAMASVFLLPLSAATEPIRLGHDDFLWAAGAVVILGVVCTGLAMFIFYRLIQKEGPLFAGMVGYIIPSVALIIGALDKETINAAQVLVLLGIFAMVLLVQTGSAKPIDHTHDIDPDV